MAGSFGGGATSASWTTSGSGTFDNPGSMTAVYTPGATDIAVGSVTLTLTTNDPEGPCPAAGYFMTLTIHPAPNVTATPAGEVICSGATTSVTLESNVPGTTFAWTVTRDGVSGASAGSGEKIEQSLSATGNTMGTVTYTVTPTANGCSGTPVSIAVTVIPNPLALVPADITIGECKTLTVDATGSGTEVTYTWTGTGASYLNNLDIADPTFGPAPDGSYSMILKVTNQYGCTASNDMTITVDPAPTAEVPADVTIGECKTLSVDATGTGTAITYAWTGSGAARLSATNIEDPVFSGAPVGSYPLILNVTDEFGCSATDAVTTVHHLPLPIVSPDITRPIQIAHILTTVKL